VAAKQAGRELLTRSGPAGLPSSYHLRWKLAAFVVACQFGKLFSATPLVASAGHRFTISNTIKSEQATCTTPYLDLCSRVNNTADRGSRLDFVMIDYSLGKTEIRL
jgi:hypothetical protein